MRKSSLQKQVSYFNHRVVTLVADKLERQWLWDVTIPVRELPACTKSMEVPYCNFEVHL